MEIGKMSKDQLQNEIQACEQQKEMTGQGPKDIVYLDELYSEVNKRGYILYDNLVLAEDGECMHLMNSKTCINCADDFELDKVEDYTTEQLQKFLDDIESNWVKTNELYSMTDLLEINRELTLREYGKGTL